MPASIRAAQRRRDDRRVGAARCATVFGEYRAPTGVAGARSRRAPTRRARGAARARSTRVATQLGRTAEAARRQAGPRRPLERRRADRACARATPASRSSTRASALTPAQIVARARCEEGVHLVGLSIHSGSHHELVPRARGSARAAASTIAGGRRRHHPRGRRASRCERAGVARVYTPKDFDLTHDHARPRASWSQRATAQPPHGRRPSERRRRCARVRACARATARRSPAR